jgi:hypothetical protein
MKRIACTVLAAFAVSLAAAAPAHAEVRRTMPLPAASAWDRGHGDGWRELARARRAFYARWNGNLRERARFERWYAHRCEQLRRSRW